MILVNIIANIITDIIIIIIHMIPTLKSSVHRKTGEIPAAVQFRNKKVMQGKKMIGRQEVRVHMAMHWKSDSEIDAGSVDGVTHKNSNNIPVDTFCFEDKNSNTQFK